MGFLSGGADGGEGGESQVEGSVSDATEAPEGGTEPGGDPQDAAPPPRTERVPLGRRAEAKARKDSFEKELGSIKESLSKQEREYREELSRRDTEIARLRGAYEALQPMVSQRQAQAEPPPADPAALRREARKALDANDFDGYEAKTQEAMLIEAERRILARLPQQQAQPVQNPVVSALLAQFPAVLQSGQRGMDLAVVEDRKLAILGHQDGPDRWRKAMELASVALGGSQETPRQYSASSRETLAGLPTARSSAGSSANEGPGVELSTYELQVAERAGMSREEYAKYMAEAYPERVRR